MCPDTTAATAGALSRRLELSLTAPADVGGRPHPVQVSIGVATAGTAVCPSSTTPAALLHAADLPRYAATRHAAASGAQR